MDETYVLILKSELKNLKENNLKLKKELDILNFQKTNLEKPKSELENKISENQIEEIFKIINILKEDKFNLKSELFEIKDLNKKTLNEILTKDDNYIFKLDKIIENFEILIHSFDLFRKKNIDEFSKLKNSKNNDNNNFDPLINNDEKNNIIILKKIEGIEDFIDKLKILLAQVKSDDLKI